MHPCHSFQHLEGVRGIGRLVIYLSRQCIIYFIMYRLCTINDICGGTCETIGDLNRSLRSRHFASVIRVKGQVLHHEHAHLKVLGCSLVLSALLTKKLPTFFVMFED